MLKYLLIISLVVLFLFLVNPMKNLEGFQTFDQCRALGYTKSFCTQTPVSVFGPAGCMCPDGSMGKIYPGLRGECMCDKNITSYFY